MKYFKNLTDLLLLCCLFLALSCQEQSAKKPEMTNFYLGTYTNGPSEGIYKYVLTNDGRLQDLGLMAKAENPSFLAFDKSRNYLLAVNEVSNENSVGYVSSFKISTDSLIFLDKKPTGGAHPCHITSNSDGFIVVANYSGGNMGLLQIKEEGQLSDLLDVQQHEGSGSHSRQEAPHAHSGWFDNDGGLISVDLGTNQLWLSKIDKDSLKFKPEEPPTFDMEDSAGPRHLTFHPDQSWVYVINELTSSVSLVYKDKDGYKIQQTISTLPPAFTEYNVCADIHISADGKFLYASNRGHNSIAMFAVEEATGQLTAIGHESTRGATPRNFSLSPDGNFLLVANQDSNNIVSFSRSIENGLLTFVDEIQAPTPVCILFE